MIAYYLFTRFINSNIFAAMQMHLYNILPQLQPYIKVICTMQCDEDADTSHIRVLPDTCVEIFLNYTTTPIAIIDNELHRRSIVNFRMNRPMDVQMRKGAGCVAICFHPGMAYKFFNIPMSEFSNSTALLSDLWNAKAAELEDILSDSHNDEHRVKILQNFLLEQLAGNSHEQQIAYCISQIVRSDGNIALDALTDKAGLSQRQLNRKFQQHVGLPPGEYLRVNKFIKSLKYLKSYPSNSLTEIAYHSGYYDQSHFIRDYKNYTGFTPGEVARSKNILY